MKTQVAIISHRPTNQQMFRSKRKKSAQKSAMREQWACQVNGEMLPLFCKSLPETLIMPAE